MADFDPKTATLREVAELYAKKAKRDKNFVSSSIQYFKDIADEPGSALLLFQKDDEGRTLLSKTFTTLPEKTSIKAAMQNLRQVGVLLKENIGPDTPEYKLLPDSAPDTDLNKRIFGRAEPPKAEAQLAISADPKKQAQLFAGVSKFLDNPETRPAALAIIFNLNTGLRPNAVLGLTLDQYYPDTGAVYIESDAKGAKGRAVNIPLNPVADSILQELLLNKKRGDPFFTKPKGGKVTTTDVNKILRSVKVPNIMYDESSKTMYDSLHSFSLLRYHPSTVMILMLVLKLLPQRKELPPRPKGTRTTLIHL
jgi:integrase